VLSPRLKGGRRLNVANANANATSLELTRHEESEIMLGMFRAINAYAWDINLQYLYMLTTRPLARLVKRLGVVCEQIGEGIEHRGTRYPFLINVDQSWAQIKARSAEVAQMSARQHLAYSSCAALSIPYQPKTVAAISERTERHECPTTGGKLAARC
jgi:N-acyl amino acid synthase of PEP-CTERM/exosortase system